MMAPLLSPQRPSTAEAKAEKPPITATAINVPIKPYSIEVAPDRSFQNFFSTVFASMHNNSCVKLNADSLTIAELVSLDFFEISAQHLPLSMPFWSMMQTEAGELFRMLRRTV